MQTMKHISQEIDLKIIWDLTKKSSFWVYDKIGEML